MKGRSLYYLQLAVNGLSQGLVVGLAALGITLVFGIARFANASAGDGLSFGAYMAWFGQRMTGSLMLGGLFAVLVGALASIVAYKLVFKKLAGRSSVALLVGSIGLGFLLRGLMGVAFGHQQMVFEMQLSPPYRLGGVAIGVLDLQMAGVAAICLAVAFGTLYFTSIGRQMRAVADNPDLARVSGIQPQRVMVALWCLVGGVTAVGGLILGVKTVVSPEIGWLMLLPAFAAAILGGIGSPVGAVLAGLLLGVAQEVATPFVGFTYKIALSFLVILLVLLVRPRGLLGRIEGVR
jgi:branched-chain amino acid transport system permease protein